MKFKHVNKLHNNDTLQIASSAFLWNSLTTNLRFVNENICSEGDVMEVKARMVPCFTVVSGWLIEKLEAL
jgi:hypothetical protein